MGHVEAARRAYRVGGWERLGISFEQFAQHYAMSLEEREQHRAELYPDNAAGICPGGCLRNYADPLPHCAGCSMRCTSYENGGADNGGIAPAT